MRSVHDFPGGIHPPDNKAQSLQQPIRAVRLPAYLYVPLHQHIGEPAQTLVSEGERVLKGQKLAEASGQLSVPVHAPTSGTVTAIQSHNVPHPSGLSDWCVRIEPDGADQWCELEGCEDESTLAPAELLRRIREAGIAGMGGAGFPTSIKLQPPEANQVETLILNGAECEPYITADQALMRERAVEVVAGLQIMRRILSPRECLIGIEDNKPDAIAALREALEDSGIELVVVPTKYPSGGEKQLIELLTGQEVPHGGIPADIGVMCQNVGTACAVYRAIRFGEPLISRITTLTGAALTDPGNREVLIGTPISHLLAQAGQQEHRTQRLIMGGPMMGFTLPSKEVPVVKTTNCLIAGTPEEFPPPPPAQPCIRCGMCEQVCPMELLPQQLYWFARSGEHDKAEQFNLFDCIECGACAYVCPSAIPLVQYYQHTKGEIRQKRIEQEKSDRARERFEQRQARIEREKAEKEARRKARKEAATAAPSVPPEQSTEPAPSSSGRDSATTRAEQASSQGAVPVHAATGPDIETLTERRDKARDKVEDFQQRLADARENAPETVAKLERALQKNEQRLEAAEKALADARALESAD